MPTNQFDCAHVDTCKAICELCMCDGDCVRCVHQGTSICEECIWKRDEDSEYLE